MENDRIPLGHCRSSSQRVRVSICERNTVRRTGRASWRLRHVRSTVRHLLEHRWLGQRSRFRQRTKFGPLLAAGWPSDDSLRSRALSENRPERIGAGRIGVRADAQGNQAAERTDSRLQGSLHEQRRQLVQHTRSSLIVACARVFPSWRF